jgi:hypothetical protein
MELPGGTARGISWGRIQDVTSPRRQERCPCRPKALQTQPDPTAKLGFAVKEMIGGLEYWRREGQPVQGTEGAAAPMHG